MADYPLDPQLSKTLISSVEMNCSDEVVTIVAMTSAQNIFHRPKNAQDKADQKRKRFMDPSGDHITLLNVYTEWVRNSRSSNWCMENFIQPRVMTRVNEVRSQLIEILGRHRQRVISCGKNTTIVRQAFCSGFFRNSARKDPAEGYKTLVEGTPVALHPSSALFQRPSEHVIYHSLVETTKEYMHVVSAIEPKWLVEAAPTFFKVAGVNGEMSKRKKAERIQPLHNKFAGEDDWRLSSQRKQGRGGGGTWG
jgi:ATP-dependent RNA helicase DHX8/PRP22